MSPHKEILWSTSTSKALATTPPVWFITGCSTGFGLGVKAKPDELRRDFTAGEAVARAADFSKLKAGAGA